MTQNEKHALARLLNVARTWVPTGALASQLTLQESARIFAEYIEWSEPRFLNDIGCYVATKEKTDV